MAQLNTLTDIKARENNLNALKRAIGNTEYSSIVAATPSDIVIASMFAYLNQKPLYYPDEKGKINISSGLWGTTSIIVADRLDDPNPLSSIITQVVANGGRIEQAFALADPNDPTKKVLEDLK